MRARALGTATFALIATLCAAVPARATISPAQTIDGPSDAIVDVGGVAMSQDGTGGIVYRKRVGGRVHIFASQFSGDYWHTPQQVDAGQAFDSSWPAIGAGDGGRLVVTWVQAFGGGQTDRLFSASLDPGATRFQAPVAVDLNVGDATGTYPSLAMNPGGNAYLAYRVPAEVGSDQNIIPGYLDMDTRVARYDGSFWSVLGSPADRNQSLPVRAPTAANSPKIGIDVAGNGLIAFQEPDESFVDRIWARRIFGTTFGIPLLVSPQQYGGAPLRGNADAFSLDVAGFGEGAVAFRQQPGQGSALPGPRVFINTIPEAFSDNASNFAGPRLADAGSAAPGWPSVGVDSSGDFRMAYSNGSAGLTTAGTDTDISPPSALGDGRGAVDPTPNVLVGKDESAVVAWRARSSVPAVEELRPNGAFKVRAVSSSSAGAVSDLVSYGSGLGDGIVGFMQGNPDSERVSAAIVDSPPLDFAIQVPLQFIRTKQPRVTWDPAPNALGRVRYTIQIGKRVYARGIFGTSFRVTKPRVPDGRSKVLVAAVDSAGQKRMGTAAALLIDTRPPRVRVGRRGRKIVVRISDGRKGRCSGVRRAAIRVSFGDGKHAAHATSLRHRYARGGSYRVVVKVRDRVGNRATVKRRVRIR
ncbi:MAG: hypothetical protein C5B48_04140 [Candidatus Rokuibacteriota bacterium]|nr:MAG: hypothetical protein C5B48_04140 [Candidatus Rokubacteria bacterium]